VEFARRGFSVTGVDRTVFLLDKARGLAAERNVTVEWVEQDMRRFERPGAFDLIVNMFTAFGYFDDTSEDLKVLENMAASLRPGGKALIDVVGKEIIARVFQPAGWDRLDDGSVLAQHRTVSADWTRIDNEWILIKGDRAERFAFGHTLYSGEELRDRMQRAGFSEVRLYGNLNGDAYDTKASRLVAVGTK
jgi:SAM-dependent methyltransferase